MRTRQYNPEIKRFINQDTVLGSITNSQSLNRYAYVQGNPISLVDRFGMSPENGKNAIGHTLLDFMGLIPGIGFVFDAANSAWYVAEGNYTMAALVQFVIFVDANIFKLNDTIFRMILQISQRK